MARFLLLTHIYPPAIDGGSRVIAKIGEYLQKHGHQILVVTTNCTSTDNFTSIRHSPVRQGEGGPDILRLPVITLFHRPFKFLGRYFPNFKTLSKGPIFSLKNFIKIIYLTKKFKPDFILAGPLPTTMVLYARLFRYSSKLLINASFHPTDLDFQTPLLLNTLKSADYIWTLTDFETNYFQQKLKIPLNKLINLGTGVDVSFLKKNPPSSAVADPREGTRGFNLLFIGSFSAHKDISTLIKAFSNLPEKYTLTLAGQKTLYFPVIKKQINSLPPLIKKRIKLISNFNNSDLSTLLDNCSILISPSLQESFGLVLIEVMARSRPVIAANIPVSTELITKSRGGLLFKAGDATDLKNKILKLSSSTQLLNSLSNNGFNYVSTHYTWDKIGEGLCQKLHI